MSSITAQQVGLYIILLVLPILPNLLAIWHIFHRNYPTVQEKTGWMALTVFLPVLGGLAYWLLGRKRGTKIQ